MSASTVSESIAAGLDRRKLVAVLHADMVGYSRLIGLDDIGTLRRLSGLRSSVIDPAVKQHNGVVVETAGDSLLIVFESIECAVRCAIEMQQQIRAEDAAYPSEHAMMFRMGIEMGDTIADGVGYHGNTVNVAARLQAECPPGDICVSQSVRDHVQNRLDLKFEGLGSLQLKNIANPVEAYVLRCGSGQDVPNSAGKASANHAVRHLDKPSIAVLAFRNMSGDPEQEYFSDGVADDVIAGLSRNRTLLVVARTSSFIYKERLVDTKLIARELGVRYIVDGSVRRDGPRIRVGVQLIDAEAGYQLWADKFDRDAGEVFVVQDEITQAIVAAIDPAVSLAERRRAIQQPLEALGAWEAYQRALYHWTKADGLSTSRKLLEQAVQMEPNFAAAHAMLGLRHLTEATLGSDLPLPEKVGLAEHEARLALDLEPDNATAHATLAMISYFQGDMAAAAAEADIALSLNWNDPQAHLIKGRILVFSGHRAEARRSLEAARRLDPHGPTALPAMIHEAISHYLEGEYEAVEMIARQTIRLHPEHPVAFRWLAAALGQLERPIEAKAALADATSKAAASFDFHVRKRPPWFRLEDHERMLVGLRKAGWQD